MSVDYKHATTEITLGNGELMYNGIGIGYLNGDDAVKFKAGYDLEKFKTGIPKTIKAIFNKESSMEITAPVMQLNPANFSMATGGGAIHTNAGTPVTVGAAIPLTFAVYAAFPGLQVAFMPGPAVTGLVVKDFTETTTFATPADYFIDAPSGAIYRNPAGSIPSLATVHITAGGYTPPASYRVDFGNLTSLAQNPLLFRHRRPDATIVEIYMDLAINSNPFECDFVGNKLIVLNVQFEGIYNEVKDRLGYIKFTPNGSMQTAPVID